MSILELFSVRRARFIRLAVDPIAHLDNYNFSYGSVMIAPDGNVYDVESSHPTWSHQNYKELGIDFQPQIIDDQIESSVDDQGNLALDRFLQEGWIRIKGDSIEAPLADFSLLAKVIELMALHTFPFTIYVEGFGKINIEEDSQPNKQDMAKLRQQRW